MRGWLRRPDAVQTVEWAQLARAALAGTIAWVVATDVLGLDQPFLAPWAAVLVVHATVYRTVSRGGQQVAATFLGILLAWGCGALLGVGAAGMAVTLVAAFLIGRLPWLAEESMSIATTGVVVLATHAIASTHLLWGRLLDNSVGVVVGLLVNVAVWPPLRDRAAREYAHHLPHELAGALAAMARTVGPNLSADDVEEWLRRCRDVDEQIDHAWGLVQQARESSRLNPRRSQPADLEEMVRMLHLLEEAVADAMSVARTMATSAHHANVWDDTFRDRWQRLLGQAAEALDEGDTGTLRGVRDDLTRFARELSTDDLARRQWHEYGGVLVNLRNIVDAALELSVWGRDPDSAPARRARYELRPPVRRLDGEKR